MSVWLHGLPKPSVTNCEADVAIRLYLELLLVQADAFGPAKISMAALPVLLFDLNVRDAVTNALPELTATDGLNK